MTSTTLLLRRPPRPVGRVRKAFCALAIIGCLPYLGLKLLWLGGSRAGIPADSVLLEGDGTMLLAINALTLVMDALVVLLALALVRPWGRGLPAAPLLLPLWAATGLLAPMMSAVPGQTLLALFSDRPSTSGTEAQAFLDGWVSQVVYGSFTVQGLALGVLLIGYLRDRWGHLVRGRARDLPSTRGDLLLRVPAGAAVAVAAVTATVHLLWAAGTGWGLEEEYAQRLDAGLRLNEAGHTFFALAAVTALLSLVFRVLPNLRLRTAVLLGWVGGSTLASWGGWWLLMAFASVGGRDGGEQGTTAVQWFTYSAQMTSGVLVLLTSVRLAGRYLDAPRARPRPTDPTNAVRTAPPTTPTLPTTPATPPTPAPPTSGSSAGGPLLTDPPESSLPEGSLPANGLPPSGCPASGFPHSEIPPAAPPSPRGQP
ncbi:hypothetical protein MTQ01_10885 [Streptomyces sp. XM4193]|uniref:hypothetical protein n=1 Tax=Streptomyces sp. XM4193 TaxID=2929782 RepID=UPI001FFB0763|nr:hypothetical protein [Streptomyces sp. XM4193]MCK1796505.1 hypothetical protein [Streptomyces sp. XM4193]